MGRSQGKSERERGGMVWDLVVFKGEVGIEEVGEEERDWDKEEESDEKSRSSENSEPLRPANTPDKVSATDCAEEWCTLNRLGSVGERQHMLTNGALIHAPLGDNGIC